MDEMTTRRSIQRSSSSTRRMRMGMGMGIDISRLLTLLVYVLAFYSCTFTTFTNAEVPVLTSFGLDCNYGILTLVYENLVSARTLNFNGTFLSQAFNDSDSSNAMILQRSAKSNSAGLYKLGNTTDVEVYLYSDDFATMKLMSLCDGPAPYITLGLFVKLKLILFFNITHPP